MANTVNLKGNPIRKEGVATEAMKPGHFVVSIPRTNSQNGSLAFPAAAGAVAQGLVFENELEGQGIDVAYASGANVLYGVWPKGGEVLGRVAAGGDAIAAGAPLAVQTDGTVAAATVGTHHVIGTAIAAVDNSGGGTEAFIQIEMA